MSDTRNEERAPGVKTVALATVLGLVILLSLGIMAGAGIALLDGSDSLTKGAIILAVALAAGLAALWGLMRLKPWAGSGEPISPKTRKARNLLLGSGALGGVIGAVLALSTINMDDPFALYSNGPLPRTVVIPILAVWFLIVPAISWQWHRNVDEHEAEAYKFGGIAALYLYLFVAPAWWLAWRAGMVPAPETMVIYMVVIGVMGIGWFWRRNR